MSNIIKLNSEQEKMLNDAYYEKKLLFGRDKLFYYLKDFPGHPTQVQVNQWLKDQQIHQLHLKQKRSTSLKPIVAQKPDTYYQIDLIDMGNNEYNGYRYILTLIDVFSRQAYCIACKNKTPYTITKKFAKLLNKLKGLDKGITRLQSDNGGEFTDSVFRDFLKENNIKQVFSKPGKPQTQGIIERFNGTLKNIIFKDISATNNKDWSSKLNEYIDSYNDTYHTTIKMTPNEAGNARGIAALKNIKKRAQQTTGRVHDDIEIGDNVRLKIFKGKLEKYSKPNWSRKVYNVTNIVQPREPYSSTKYFVDDGKKIAYSRNDIQKIVNVVKPPTRIRTIPESEWEVDRITEKKKVNGRMRYLVYWKGYDEPTWEPFQNVKETEAYDTFLKSTK